MIAQTSILVILDHALEVRLVQPCFGGAFCFNPSYFGLCSGRYGQRYPGPLDFTEFQSLLFWITLWKICWLSSKGRCPFVSILLVLDIQTYYKQRFNLYFTYIPTYYTQLNY